MKKVTREQESLTNLRGLTNVMGELPYLCRKLDKETTLRIEKIFIDLMLEQRNGLKKGAK